jgi:RimJ/RimL family protein N-acetyltransferase
MTALASEARGSAGAASFSVLEPLRDGRQVEIRALRPTDADGLKAAIARISSQSLYRRFFGPKRNFSEKEVAHFVNIDFVAHVALVVIADHGGQPTIVGGGRYIVARPGAAELAFAIVDEYQQQGIGAALLRHLMAIARRAGLTELVASVLPDNRPMLTVFEHCGLPVRTRRERDAVIVTLQLA